MRQLLTEGVLIGLAAGGVTLIASPTFVDLIWREVQSRIVFRFSDLYVLAFDFRPAVGYSRGRRWSPSRRACFSVWWAQLTARRRVLTKRCKVTWCKGRQIAASCA